MLPDPWAEPPLHLLDTGDGRARISRAWRAGCWAREVLEGRLNYPNSTPALSPPLRNRFYCIARGFCGPAVHSTFAAFPAQVGRLEDGDTITQASPQSRKLALILLPLACLTLACDDRPASFCLRRGGLCGASRILLAPASGPRPRPGAGNLPGLCRDAPPERLPFVRAQRLLPGSLALRVSDARPFLPDKPDTFPLASEVVRKSRAWVAENLGGLRSGYQTAVSEPPAGAAKAPARAKKPTVAHLAAQQECIAKALAGISAQLVQISSASEPGGRPGPRPPAPAGKGRYLCTSGRHSRPWSGRGGNATAEPSFSSATRMRSAAVRRIAPATAALLQQGLMTRYLERFGRLSRPGGAAPMAAALQPTAPWALRTSSRRP